MDYACILHLYLYIVLFHGSLLFLAHFIYCLNITKDQYRIHEFRLIISYVSVPYFVAAYGQKTVSMIIIHQISLPVPRNLSRFYFFAGI